MNFEQFKNNSSKLSGSALGGLNAQFKLAPKIRLKYTPERVASNRPKKAAVLALFYPNSSGETCFLLTLRASYNGVHSAQISFPGGKFDPKDKTLKITALRETYEEIGIRSEAISILKKMTDVYIPPSNFLVTPFLGILNHQPNFKTNEEVEKIIEPTLYDFLKDSAVSTTTVTTSYAQNIEVPCFKLEKHTIWGATAMMLSEIRELLKTL